MTPAIEINNLVKFYGKREALKGISFSVADGEFFGFLGPNGAGKTTTIHSITGLVKYQSGDIKVFGHDVVADYRKTRALIGFVPQEFNFDPYLTAEQILTFEAGYFGVPRAEARRRAQRLLEEFDLLGHRLLDYRKLSGGMKRRLLIARGLVHKPKILILDEPTAGVDVELRLKLWDFLRHLNEKGITILLTTHYIEEAERLCKRIGVIHQGKMIAIETTEKLIRELGKHVITISVDRNFPEVPRELRQFGVELANNGHALKLNKNEEHLNTILKLIYAQGLNVTGIDTEKTDLEDIFIKLTKDK